METATPKRAFAYVDGFNLFYGLKSARFRKYYWLDLETLCKGFSAKNSSQLIAVKYFTARIKANPDKHVRQSLYLGALGSCGLVEIFEGNYAQEPNECANCYSRRPLLKEKQTDTNIATEMVADAFLDRWDVAYLVSGDSDLVPPVRLVKNQFPKKKVIVVSPPMRHSKELAAIAGSSFHLIETMLKSCQFPDSVPLGENTADRPDKWN